MRRAAKIWLITAAFLVLTGSILFVGVMTVLNWDFTKLSTARYETNEHVPEGDFQNISVETITGDVLFAPSENGKASVVCYEAENVKHAVSVKDGTLVIEAEDTRKWYEYIGVNFETPKITVYLPREEYGKLSVKSHTGDIEIPKDFHFESMDVLENTGNVTCRASASGDIRIKTSTGKIQVENISAGELDLSVSTGKVTVSGLNCAGNVKIKATTGKTKITDVVCKNLFSDGSTGDLTLKNVVAAEKFTVERSTGDIELDGCDGGEIFLKTDTGDVEGTLLSEKVFVIETDTGDVEVPKSVTGGRCEITTDTGDIEIGISD